MEDEQTPLPLAIIPESSCESSSPQVFTFDQDLVADMQLKCIIKGNLPFHTFDSDVSTELFQCLQPAYERVSSTTIRDRALKHYIQARKDLIKYFQNYESKVSLSIHPWQTTGGYYNVPYTCITCHWIDRETWKISKRIIGLEQYELDLDDVVLTSLSKFNLKDKVLSISVDDSDGFYTTTMSDLKGKVDPLFDGVFFQTKCVCHILNSMVKSSLDHVADVIAKFESLCAYVFYYHGTEFKKFVRAKGAKFSHIAKNIPDRWNTTYTMLGRMLKHRLQIEEFYADSGQEDIVLDDEDWEIIESLLGILKVFHSSTIRLSDAYYPTTPLVLGEILIISHMFKEYKQDPFWEPAVLEMQSKLLTYYETMPEVFTCAAALNPKIGIGGVENLLEDIVGCLGLNGSDYAKNSMRKCLDALHEAFGYYDKVCRSRIREKDVILESSSRNVIMESVSRKKARSVMILNELELYKKTDFSSVMSCDEYESFDVLEWWRNKGCHQYPILAEMAGDILSVQASVLTLEYAFWLNGRVLDETTSYNMSQAPSPKYYEMRIFLKEDLDMKEGKRSVGLLEDGDESEYDDETEDGDECEGEELDPDECEDDDYDYESEDGDECECEELDSDGSEDDDECEGEGEDEEMG